MKSLERRIEKFLSLNEKRSIVKFITANFYFKFTEKFYVPLLYDKSFFGKYEKSFLQI